MTIPSLFDGEPKWRVCEGGQLQPAGAGWYRCPSCKWVGWKMKHPQGAPTHRRPNL